MVKFRDDIEHEPISSLPLREAIAVHAGTLLRAAVASMRHQSIGCAVIVRVGMIPVGLFTEKSLIKALVSHDSLDDHPVSQYADTSFVSVSASEPISRVWDAICRDGIRFVCVTDDEGKLVGVTGQRAISEYIAEYFPQQVMVQRLGCTPWMQQREGA